MLYEPYLCWKSKHNNKWSVHIIAKGSLDVCLLNIFYLTILSKIIFIHHFLKGTYPSKHRRAYIDAEHWGIISRAYVYTILIPVFPWFMYHSKLVNNIITNWKMLLLYVNYDCSGYSCDMKLYGKDKDNHAILLISDHFNHAKFCHRFNSDKFWNIQHEKPKILI